MDWLLYLLIDYWIQKHLEVHSLHDSWKFCVLFYSMPKPKEGETDSAFRKSDVWVVYCLLVALHKGNFLSSIIYNFCNYFYLISSSVNLNSDLQCRKLFKISCEWCEKNAAIRGKMNSLSQEMVLMISFGSKILSIFVY